MGLILISIELILFEVDSQDRSQWVSDVVLLMSNKVKVWFDVFLILNWRYKKKYQKVDVNLT